MENVVVMDISYVFLQGVYGNARPAAAAGQRHVISLLTKHVPI